MIRGSWKRRVGSEYGESSAESCYDPAPPPPHTIPHSVPTSRLECTPRGNRTAELFHPVGMSVTDHAREGIGR